MGIFKKFVSEHTGYDQDDVLQFIWGVSSGLLFLWWIVWTWKLFLLA